MKYYILLASLVSLTVAAPLTGSATGSLTANNADIDIAASTKNFTAIMYLLAPDSWVNAWNEIPDEGKQCFLKTATNPANAEIYNSEDNEKIKNDLKSKCASSYDQLAKFCDQTDATMKQLPKSFTDISKSWGQQMQDLGNQYKNAGSNAATQNADAVKSMITQFAKPTGDYFNKLAALSQEDRQKLSDAFPKLQPIFSGEHSVEFLKEITQLYQTMGSGDFNPDSYKDTGKNLVNTWGSIWNEYKSRNADGLKKAGDLLGKNLTKCGDDFANQLTAKASGASAGTYTGVAAPVSASGSMSASASGPMGTNTFGSKFAASNPELANEIHKRVEESKAKLEEAKDKLQGAFHDASETGKAKFEDAKNAAQQKWSDFKGQADQFKQEHFGEPSGSASGSFNINGDSASAGVKVN